MPLAGHCPPIAFCLVSLSYAVFWMVPAAVAQNCGSPPSGYGPAWARQYAAWCQCMGGKLGADAQSCVGARNQDSGANATADADPTPGAVQATENAEEWVRQHGQAEPPLPVDPKPQANIPHAEMIRRIEEALRDMQRGGRPLDDRDLLTEEAPPGARDAQPPHPPVARPAAVTECKWGDQDPSVVDLRCLGLDPDKPITLDWHVVAGKERAFPAQIDPATLNNVQYNLGFVALMRPGYHPQDAEDAISHFKIALLQRPNDPLVRNGLYLAQDILRARLQREKENRERAVDLLGAGVAALMSGHPENASESMLKAMELDPDNQGIVEWARVTYGLNDYCRSSDTPEARDACRLVGNALVFESLGEFANSLATLELARARVPGDLFVKTMIWREKHLALPKGSAPAARPD